MNAKEKAKELYCKYTDALNIRDLQTTANPFAKQCALIAVDEIINHHSQEQGLYRIDTYYYQQVKEEIEKL
jgi:imidazole glycerol phosphate synthase subunit HisF